jgi:hypothetical protein
MGNNTEKPPEQRDYDISIIRPEMRVDDITLRGQGMSPERLKGINGKPTVYLMRRRKRAGTAYTHSDIGATTLTKY